MTEIVYLQFGEILSIDAKPVRGSTIRELDIEGLVIRDDDEWWLRSAGRQDSDWILGLPSSEQIGWNWGLVPWTELPRMWTPACIGISVKRWDTVAHSQRPRGSQVITFSEFLPLLGSYERINTSMKMLLKFECRWNLNDGAKSAPRYLMQIKPRHMIGRNPIVW